MQRQNRLQNRTPAELKFEEILNEIGIDYEKEKIIQNGDRFVLVDFVIYGSGRWCLGAIEIDGGVHKQQRRYDTGRDEWLETKGIRTIRFTNKEVLKNQQQVIEKVMELLK